jgi:ADP-ribosylglycohydrolase
MPRAKHLPVEAIEPTRKERFHGCLLGGAAGDALGAPVEFMSFRDIEHRFGAMGIQDYVPAYGRIGAITDDTQMTLFTAEGLLRSWVYTCRGGDEKTWVDFMHESYQQWLRTQDAAAPHSEDSQPGWLASQRELFHQRAPGNTCLSSLYAGLPGRAQNNSKGCGGIMRAAPVGLWLSHQNGSVARIFGTGIEMAAITHGHPSGSLPAAVFALLVAQLVRGESLREALRTAKTELLNHKGHLETLHALEAAEQAARIVGIAPQAAIEKLGGGWIAEDALAIAVFCALKAESLEEGVVMAVNHGGDSDSTGSMVGNLLGCVYGVQQIPARWLGPLELREVITQVANDLLSGGETELKPDLVERWG